jgi:hydrogenase maturation protein HypF
MVEHGLQSGPVLGVAWDGTGLGADGSIWGGEFIIADSLTSMSRVAHLRPFRLIGGEAAVREPWRVASALLVDAIGRGELDRRGLAGVKTSQLRRLLDVAQRPWLHPLTTSAGRLFDAAACLILSMTLAPFDGAPAMLLEAIADPAAAGKYPFPLTDDSPRQLDWRPLFVALWTDLHQGVAPAVVATRFHRTLARGIADVVSLHPWLPVVLGGGVFQNRLLAELLLEELNGDDRLYLPGRIPPNDGGIAAGQLAIALEAMR